MKSSTTLGLSLLAGAALIETALIPGLVIGAAIVLVPKVLPKFVPKAQKRPQPSEGAAATSIVPATAIDTSKAKPSSPFVPSFAVKQAIFKTITFRMVATSLDFTANMVVIGDFATAAGLSAFGLVVAPLYYFGHEVVWNKLAPAGTRVNVGVLMRRKNQRQSGAGSELTMNRSLAKTITYEVIAVTADFTANYVASGDVAAAAGLTLFALVMNPIIYYGHEKAWDYFGGRRLEPNTPPQQPVMALMAPA